MKATTPWSGACFIHVKSIANSPNEEVNILRRSAFYLLPKRYAGLVESVVEKRFQVEEHPVPSSSGVKTVGVVFSTSMVLKIDSVRFARKSECFAVRSGVRGKGAQEIDCSDDQVLKP